MSPWVLLGISALVLYGLWLLLGQVFFLIDLHRAIWREERYRAADSRNNGRKRSGRRSA